MSLLKRKQEKDRKAAEEAARLAEEKKLQDLAVHPLAKGGCGRDVRDAYLQGLVFAAIADDDKTDENERPLLVEIGTSLGMSGEEVEGTIKGVLSLDDDGKLALVEECVTAFKGNEVGVKLFYAQFIQIWTSHEHDEKELSDYLRQFGEWTGIVLPDKQKGAILKSVDNGNADGSSLVDLADWMGDDALKYFIVKRHGDVSEILADERKCRKAAEARRIEQARIESVRSEFAAVIDQMSEEHKLEASLHSGWEKYLSKNLAKFFGKDIDWVKECNLRLSELSRIPHCYSKLLCRGQERPRRKIVWKLVCMLYVHVCDHGGTFSVYIIDDLLRVATQLSTEGYYKRITDFIKRYFSSVVSLE